MNTKTPRIQTSYVDPIRASNTNWERIGDSQEFQREGWVLTLTDDGCSLRYLREPETWDFRFEVTTENFLRFADFALLMAKGARERMLPRRAVT